MSTALLAMSTTGIVLTLVCSVLAAELVGYALHRLMHNDRLPAMSRAHLIHHLLLYGPKQPLRTAEYKDATSGRASIGNVGLEWIIPSGLILAVWLTVLWLLHMPPAYRLLSAFTLLTWSGFMFSYLHDRMHIQNFWMERTPVLNWWFRKARRLHDIHHRSLDSEGRMDKNFGIGFFFFDRIFRTFAKRHCPFNWHGYRAAVRRHRLEHLEDDDFTSFPSGFHV
ncbi:MAG TPA: sterol desaturase family protein [Candidatus Acidoferrum sp.]|nr:sterol desaturase family protein [Candidatus Acidoferrum sp.]